MSERSSGSCLARSGNWPRFSSLAAGAQLKQPIAPGLCRRVVRGVDAHRSCTSAASASRIRCSAPASEPLNSTSNSRRRSSPRSTPTTCHEIGEKSRAIVSGSFSAIRRSTVVRDSVNRPSCAGPASSTASRECRRARRSAWRIRESRNRLGPRDASAGFAAVRRWTLGRVRARA